MTKSQKIASSLAELNAFRATEGLDAHTAWAKGPMGEELTAYRTQAALDAKRDEQALVEVSIGTPSVESPNGDETITLPAPVKAPAKVKVAKEPYVWSNNVFQPRAGTLCRQAWDLFDDCYNRGLFATASIVELGHEMGLNRGNLRTEISRWRKFHGIARPTTAKPEPVETSEQMQN